MRVPSWRTARYFKACEATGGYHGSDPLSKRCRDRLCGGREALHTPPGYPRVRVPSRRTFRGRKRERQKERERERERKKRGHMVYRVSYAGTALQPSLPPTNTVGIVFNCSGMCVHAHACVCGRAFCANVYAICHRVHTGDGACPYSCCPPPPTIEDLFKSGVCPVRARKKNAWVRA